MTTLIIGLLIPLLWPVSSSTVISSILFLQKLAGREAVVANENPKPISPLQFTIIGIAVVQLERLGRQYPSCIPQEWLLAGFWTCQPAA